MLICPKCNHQNRPGTFACDNCSWLLTDEYETVYIPEDEQQKMVFAYQVHHGSFGYDKDHKLPPGAFALHIQSATQPVILLPRQNPYLVGRATDEDSSCDVDLSPYEGDQKGVSRRHAIIFFEGGTWMIEDIGSTNGTRINDYKLNPKESFPVEHGDVLQFGLCIAQVEVAKTATTAKSGGR